jgi:predicted nuclease of restriction endonuclease-like (RecB) superfamily
MGHCLVSVIELVGYAGLLADIKSRIQAAQARAVLAANAELIRLYWDVGHQLDQRQAAEGWGAAVIPRLASDIRNELPEVKGFSERNFKRMLAFFRAYKVVSGFGSQAVASEHDGKGASKVPQPLAQMDATMLCAIPWGHHLLLMERVKDVSVRRWYMTRTTAEGWSRNTLALMIDGRIHERQGKLTNNFAERLPAPQSGLVQQALKDPYVFDFLTPDECFHERNLETGLIRHLEKFLLELGQGFAFVGRQHKVTVAEEDFFIDLLFYHLKLRCYLVIELKRGHFKPEYAGKLNFYCNVVDDKMRHASDAATIGLILCQSKDRVLAEYALRGIDKPIGIASYEFTRALPVTLRRVLPTIEAIEAELSAAAAKTAAS